MPKTATTGSHPRADTRFHRSSDQPAGKREIAKAFGPSGHDKIALKQLLATWAMKG
jgi:ribonuclease R